MTTYNQKTSPDHLSPKQRGLLERVVHMIVRAVPVEKIFLCGQSVPPVPSMHTAFDLLIITREDERRSDYELQDIIESRCRVVAPVTALVHDISYVNKKLQDRQYFFSTILREGTLLYDARRTPLAEPGTPNWEEVRIMAEKDFDRWNGQARDFFHSAEFIRSKRSWNMAAFFLHQAAEQSYQAILLAFMGYKPTTHNLDKLRRYTNRFSVELALLFPPGNTEEEDLFRLLASGYVSARYKEEFIITEREVDILIERIRRLLDIAQRVCYDHFISLARRAAEG